MTAALLLWSCWLAAACTIGGLAWRDWHNPDEDREVVLVPAGSFALLLAVAALLIAVLA